MPAVRSAHVQRQGLGSQGPAHTDWIELLNAEELIEKVQVLQEDLDQIADPRARATAEELVGAIVELYGEGMRRIVDVVDGGGEEGARIREEMSGDGVIASLLLIHDLYPVPLDERVTEALDQIRPYLDSHGGGVELLDVTDGVARIRLEGSCKTCPASSATLELAVKQALDEAAPDLAGLIVEGIQGSEPEQPSGFGLPVLQVQADGAQAQPSKAAQAQAAFNASQAGSTTPEPHAARSDGAAAWHQLNGAAGVDEGRLQSTEAGGIAIAVARVDGTLLAFRDCCPACSSPITAGTLLGGILACPECGIRYELPRAGLAVEGGGQLDPVPLLAQDGGVRVAIHA